jgi:hypothetical protein
VLFIASGLSDQHELEHDCSSALREMTEKGCTLVLDDEYQIESHYARKLSVGTAGLEWSKSMVLRGRSVYVKRVRVRREETKELSAIGFRTNHEDFKYYARASAASADKIIVTVDADFVRASASLRTLYGIRVLTPGAFRHRD